jgi:hypothetical protein
MAIQCLGASADCPDYDKKIFKPDKTICRDGALLCVNGSCILSVCELHSLLPCQLTEPDDGLCMIACLQKDGSCVPYHTIDTTLNPSKSLYFPCKK